jgi:hypothetical protein
MKNNLKPGDTVRFHESRSKKLSWIKNTRLSMFHNGRFNALYTLLYHV